MLPQRHSPSISHLAPLALLQGPGMGGPLVACAVVARMLSQASIVALLCPCSKGGGGGDACWACWAVVLPTTLC